MAELVNSDCVTLEILSDDLVLRLSEFLDIPTSLRLSSTCSGYSELLNMSDVWRSLYKHHWPHAASPDLPIAELRVFWRNQVFRRARTRFDGLYVSRCVYIRRIQEGASMTDNRTSMQIVYHRIIRFLPDYTAYMLLSEKGTKGSARQAFRDLADVESNPSVVEKYGKQLHKCHWRCVHEDARGATIVLSFFDGKLCWSAKLIACHGTSSRQTGTRLAWEEYKFWDPSEVAEHRRRQLYRERDAIAARLRFAHLSGTNIDTISDLLYQVERLGDAMRSVREVHDDDVDAIPEELTKEITLWTDHFPIGRFVHSKQLAHLF